jgi:hypothetical protein
MQEHQDDILRHVSALADRFSDLHRRLLQAANDLHDPGIPPPEGLLADLTASHADFIALRTRIVAHAESLAVPTIPRPEHGVSLKHLKDLLQVVMEAEEKRATGEQVRHRALNLLDRVLAIVHSDRTDFAPLLECQAQARDLFRAIADSPWPQVHAEAEPLTSGNHPFVDLLTFIEGLRELDDDRWATLHDSVTRAFGRALVVAIARGKLHLPQESAADVISTSPTQSDEALILAEQQESIISPRLEQPSESVQTEQIGPGEGTRSEAAHPLGTPEGTQTETAKDAVADAILIADEVPSQSAVGEAERLVHRPLSTAGPFPGEGIEVLTDPATSAPPSPRAEIQLGTDVGHQMTEGRTAAHPFYGFSAGETASQIATAVLNGIVDDQVGALRDLIWRLIFEDKVGLAFHVACSVEGLYPSIQPCLPSWLVRAVALGPHVRHASGDTARLLKQDFSKFSEDCFTPEGSDWNHAVRFLCAAAALRPALLAPDSYASTVLHALYLKEGLGQLYEYCQIVATYGEQLHPLDLNALKNVKNQAAWEADRDALHQEVEAWCAQAPQMTIAYAPATKVWRKWQERHGFIHSLLLPVRENDLNKLEAAKQNVDRLSDDAQIKREVEHTDRKVLGRRGGEPITARAFGQIRMHVHEALMFVRRWIALQEARPGQSQSYHQRKAEQLRQEVCSRQTAVIEELVRFEEQNPSLPILSGIACCRKALENIRTIFDPEAHLSADEPMPRHLLHADLLHLDALPLNDQWEPEVADPQVMVEGLLTLIAREQGEWVRTFNRHCERRDHETTARILEYLAAKPEGASQIEEFRQEREKNISDCQKALQRDVEETRKQVENAVALGLLREQERDDFVADIDGIELAIDHTLRFFEGHDQLSTIRKAILEKRNVEVEGVRQRLEYCHRQG